MSKTGKERGEGGREAISKSCQPRLGCSQSLNSLLTACDEKYRARPGLEGAGEKEVGEIASCGIGAGIVMSAA